MYLENYFVFVQFQITTQSHTAKNNNDNFKLKKIKIRKSFEN